MGLPDFTDKHFKAGDHVMVEGSGRTGTIERRSGRSLPGRPARDGWIVRWDFPMFGVIEGRVATVNLVHASEATRA